ncbi:unnamed protein product [Effrenium voratum]|uniref:dihydroorotase n=1 Tax=Effrenium voratum TaxID=2562239 RepID=A0AA36IGN6_9DINO|nr:unnamed protein product [Effrenium voratum]
MAAFELEELPTAFAKLGGHQKSGDCQVLSGGFMSAAQAAADDTSRAPDCVVEFHMDSTREPPFTVRFGAFPPKDDTSRLYSKVHSIGPDGHHRAVLLGLPSNCAHDTVGAELRAPQGMREQLPFKCSLFRRTIERGRLFGGGSKAVEEALAAILDSREPTAAAAALRCLLMVMLDAVRLWLPRPEHLSFSSLAMFAVLAAAIPWRPPAAFRAQLLRTALAAQAADQPRPYAAAAFCRVLVMPNLVPPVTTTEAALAYRARILQRLPKHVRPGDFVPLMTLYLTDKTSPAEIEKAKQSGHVYAVKLYPAGATTNSDFGVTDYELIMPALQKMEQVGLLLLVHGESTDQSVDVFEREQSFYETVMPMILGRCPKLRVVCEHITSAAAATFVEKAGPLVGATITAHHLCHNRNALFKGGINPHYYCLPILKTEPDRQKLLQCAVDNPKFFLGTDSAPHSLDKKECACGCAGCFTAHMSIELVAEAFESVGRLDALEAFVAQRGAAFYGLPQAQGTRVLTRENWKVPDNYPFGDKLVRPLRAGEEAKWKLQPKL